MKRLCTILFVLLANVSLGFSQTSDASRIARTAFEHGDYAEAINWYRSAVNLTDNPIEKATLNKSLSLAQDCAANLRHANQLFSSGNYTSAKAVYQKLLSANPSDAYAKQRIALCGQRLREVANKQKRDEAYKIAMQKGDNESIQAFLKSYPNDNEKELLTFIVSDGEQVSDYLMKIVQSRHQDSLSDDEFVKEFEALFTQMCISAGDAFFDANNKDAACKYYNMAILYGDSYALYKKAQCYDNKSNIQRRNLLAIAAESKCDAAREELSKVIENPNLKYDKDAAKRLYDNLRECRTDLKAALYVYINAELYDIDKSLAAVHFPSKNEEIIESLQNVVNGDDLLYQFGCILEELKKNPYSVMQASAAKGNIAAIKWIADKSGDAEYLRCYQISLKWDTDYKAYIKYLKGETMTAHDWYKMYKSRHYMPLNNNEVLLSLVKSNDFTDKDFFKSVKGLVAESEYWDSEIVKELLNFNYTISPGRVTKLRKILSKVKTRPGMYNKQAVPVYQLVEIGCYDNLHYSPRIKKETLWMSQTTTSVGKKYSTTISATDQPDVYGASSYSGRTAKTSAYKIGQELADGYVFYVDATGQHGKIVSKTVYSISPGKVATFRCGSGWRFCSSGELYKIYNAHIFPAGNYFAKDGPNINNYNVVVFNKKNCYNVKINWQYSYSLLLVRDF